MSEKRTIAVTVNGTRYEREVPVRITLADFIRYELKLTGTHPGGAYEVHCPTNRKIYVSGTAPPGTSPSRRSRGVGVRSTLGPS